MGKRVGMEKKERKKGEVERHLPPTSTNPDSPRFCQNILFANSDVFRGVTMTYQLLVR